MITSNGVPLDNVNFASFFNWPSALALFGIVTLRYFFVSGIFWVLFYRSQEVFQRWPLRLFSERAPVRQQAIEMMYSVVSGIIFTAAAYLIFWGYEQGWIHLWWQPLSWEWILYPLWWLALAFLHDTYFYWTHRLLHHKFFMKWVHYVHHMSRVPSPWTSFSFHPVESLINSLALPFILLVLPVPLPVFLFHLIFMTITAVTNHLGIEVMPKSFIQKGWLKWVISGYHHGWHHQYYRFNYGLFFTLWDRWMGTEKEVPIFLAR